MKEKKWLIPLGLLGIAGVLLLRKSNLAWHQSHNFVTVFGRYSTEYFFLILSIVFIAIAIGLQLRPKPQSKRRAFIKSLLDSLLIFAYTLTGCAVLTEYVFHHNPVLALGEKSSITPHEMRLGVSGMIPDSELQYLPPPNAVINGHMLFDTKYRYPSSAWRDAKEPEVEYRSDSKGFRNDREMKSADLVVLGDSYTHGPHVQRDQLWSTTAARQLGLSEANLAVTGYGPQQEVLVLKRFGLALNPRLVILQLFYGNDLFESHNYMRWRHSGLSYIDFCIAEVGELPSMFLTGEFLKRIAGKALPGYFAPSNRPIEFIAADKRFDLGFHELLKVQLFTQKEILGFPGWQSMVDALTYGKQICTERGIPLMVCLVPTKVNIYLDFIADRENQDRLVRQQFPQEAEPDVDGILRSAIERRDVLGNLLRQRLTELEIPFLDFTFPFHQHIQRTGDLLYFQWDAHWTPEGHQLAGTMIADFIRKQGILESKQQNE